MNVYGNCHRSWHFSSNCWRLISSQREMQITNTVVGFYTARREWLQKTDLSHDDAFQRFVLNASVRGHYKRNEKFPAECSLSENVEINIYKNITDAAITNDAVVLEGLRCFNCFLPQKTFAKLMNILNITGITFNYRFYQIQYCAKVMRTKFVEVRLLFSL